MDATTKTSLRSALLRLDDAQGRLESARGDDRRLAFEDGEQACNAILRTLPYSDAESWAGVFHFGGVIHAVSAPGPHGLPLGSVRIVPGLVPSLD